MIDFPCREMSSQQQKCKYCEADISTRESDTYKCTRCSLSAHLKCMNRTKPSTLKGDYLFTYECRACSYERADVLTRMRLNWVQVIHLALYNLTVMESGRQGYFRWKEEICSFIDRHWTTVMGGRARTNTWVNTVAGTLSVHSNELFKSGQHLFNESGWWALQQVVPAHVDVSRYNRIPPPPKTHGFVPAELGHDYGRGKRQRKPNIVEDASSSSSKKTKISKTSSPLVKSSIPSHLVKSSIPLQLVKTPISSHLGKTVISSQLVKSPISSQIGRSSIAFQLVKNTVASQMVKTSKPSQIVKTPISSHLVKTAIASQLIKTSEPPQIVKTSISSQLNNKTSSQLINNSMPSQLLISSTQLVKGSLLGPSSIVKSDVKTPKLKVKIEPTADSAKVLQSLSSERKIIVKIQAESLKKTSKQADVVKIVPGLDNATALQEILKKKLVPQQKGQKQSSQLKQSIVRSKSQQDLVKTKSRNEEPKKKSSSKSKNKELMKSDVDKKKTVSQFEASLPLQDVVKNKSDLNKIVPLTPKPVQQKQNIVHQATEIAKPTPKITQPIVPDQTAPLSAVKQEPLEFDDSLFTQPPSEEIFSELSDFIPDNFGLPMNELCSSTNKAEFTQVSIAGQKEPVKHAVDAEVAELTKELHSLKKEFVEENLVKVSVQEEVELLDKINKFRLVIDSDASVCRFRRKLLLRKKKRAMGLKIFNLNAQVQASLKKSAPAGIVFPAVPAKKEHWAEEQSATEERSYHHPALRGVNVLDRYMNYCIQQPSQQQTSVYAHLVGNVDDVSETRSITSPYTSRVLKPYIRRDFTTLPPKLRLYQELRQHCGTKAMHRSYPLDYCYVQPKHMPAVNALCSDFFWPGIVLTECLQYPEFSCVVLYRKLLVAFAFLVPHGVNEAYISFVFVHPDWRRAGVATHMIYHLIQTCMGKDVTLHVQPTNPAIVLYQRFGFKQEQLVLDFYDKYLPKHQQHATKHAFLMRLQR